MAKAGPTVKFLNRVSDAEVEHYAARCRALIFPGEEDFGMAPLEIAAAGRPTIAYRAGGAVETIVDGVTGVFFDRQDASEPGRGNPAIRAAGVVCQGVAQSRGKVWNRRLPITVAAVPG